MVRKNLKTIFEYLNAVGIDSIRRSGSWEYANMDAVVRMVKDYVQGTELPRVSIILNWNGWRDTIECLPLPHHLPRLRCHRGGQRLRGLLNSV